MSNGMRKLITGENGSHQLRTVGLNPYGYSYCCIKCGKGFSGPKFAVNETCNPEQMRKEAGGE